MEIIKLNVGKEFSYTPGPRYIKEGDNSGEAFRKDVLLAAMNNAIEKNKCLVVDFDGAKGYGTSFLEESFGGLIREEGLSYTSVINHLQIISTEEPWLIEDVHEYLEDAEKSEVAVA